MTIHEDSLGCQSGSWQRRMAASFLMESFSNCIKRQDQLGKEKQKDQEYWYLRKKIGTEICELIFQFRAFWTSEGHIHDSYNIFYHMGYYIPNVFLLIAPKQNHCNLALS